MAASVLYADGLAGGRADAGGISDAPGDLARPAPNDEGQAAARPTPTPILRSRAVLRAPDATPGPRVSVPPFPAFGTYIYDVDGSESVALEGSRSFQREARLRVHRPASGTHQGRSVRADEVVFELDLSQQRSEYETIAFREAGLLVTSAGRSITFGSNSSTDRSTFIPSIPRVPVPLEEGFAQRGTSQGSESGTIEWTVDVSGQEALRILDETVNTWIITVDQRTVGSSESFERTSKYWLDPQRSLWVQWEEETEIRRGALLIGGFQYESSYRAVLSRIEALGGPGG